MTEECINRREFIRRGMTTGIALGGGMIWGNLKTVSAKSPPESRPDLVAVKNHEPDIMFNKAIQMMGGMKRFVKKGQTVIVKPNIGFPKTPEIGATTNPILVKSVVEHCYSAGAKKVYVFDNVATSAYGLAQKCYQLSGIAAAAKDAGAVVAPGDAKKYYHKVNIPHAKTLTATRVHELVLESDVFINVPVLKNHGYTRLTMAMKNLMGIVWDRTDYHYSGLDQCIADFCLFKKPDLNVLDAYRVLLRHGPQGDTPEDVSLQKSLVLSTDIVACDAAAAKICGNEPQKIKYIKIAHDMGIGNLNLNKAKIGKHIFTRG
jgi:uncharacterized protein (DUF362 family)